MVWKESNKKTIMLIFFVLSVSLVYAHDFSDQLSEFKKTTPDGYILYLGDYHTHKNFPNYLAVWEPGKAKPTTSFIVRIFDKNNDLKTCYADNKNCIKSIYMYYENSPKYKCNFIHEGMEAITTGMKCEIEDTPSPGKYKIFFNYEVYNSEGQMRGSDVFFDAIVLGCGDLICDSTEQEDKNNCCSDCGTNPLYKCKDNTLELTCGNGLCESLYEEGKSNCCQDCGASPLYKCENNILIKSCGDGECSGEYSENKENCCSDCGCSSKYYKCEENTCVRYSFFKRIWVWFKGIF